MFTLLASCFKSAAHLQFLFSRAFVPKEQCAPKRWFGSDMLMINLLYLDRCDESINLTIEIEKINEIFFLDILVKRCLNNSFMTSVLWPLHQMRLDQNRQGVK